MNRVHTLELSIVIGAIALFAHTAEAASLFLVPGSGEFRTGGKITVDLKIDSEGTGINAGQATIRFPKETLQVTAVEKVNSTFSFWLEEPTYSNDDGVISFIGGTPYGVSGSSIQVLRITFTSKGSGTAPITIVDAAVTASDGSGTNVLSKTGGASFTISPTAAMPTATTPTTAAPAVPTPQQIVREAAPAAGLPIKPVLNVPLYPDPTSWYSAINVFNTRWTLPADVNGVAAVLNKQPSFTPSESEGLFDNKSFNALSDGIWYLHVRFRNNIGWGPVTHHRIAIDTVAPQPFEVTTTESTQSDSPTLNLQFKTTDALSGVQEYHIKVEDRDWITIPAEGFTGTYALPLAEPGKHRITIKAHDKAENGIEQSIEHETIPLPSPAITFVTERVFSEEPLGITIRGSALPNAHVLIDLKQADSLIATSTIPTDTLGNWEYTFTDHLMNGSYVASVQTRNDRGALSLVVSSSKITVSSKPLFQIGVFILTQQGANFLLLILIIVGTVAGWWFYKTRRERTALRVDLAESDTAKVFNMIKADIDKVDKARATPTTADDEFATQKMRDNIKRMETYVKKEIGKAKE